MLEQLAAGCVVAGKIGALVVKKDYLSAALTSAIYIFILKEKVMMTYAQFKQLLKERGVDYETAHFYCEWEEYQKNQQDLILRGVILDQSNSRHYNGNPHYTDNPHYTRPLV